MKSTSEINGVPKGDISSFPASAHPTIEGPAEVAAYIKHHAQYTLHFSPLKFEPEQAFYATADSVQDSFIWGWNETYIHFHKRKPKANILSFYGISARTIAYTNHAVLPDALEKWSVTLLTKLLPHHMEIIKEINKNFLEMMHPSHPNMERKNQ